MLSFVTEVPPMWRPASCLMASDSQPLPPCGCTFPPKNKAADHWVQKAESTHCSTTITICAHKTQSSSPPRGLYSLTVWCPQTATFTVALISAITPALMLCWGAGK